MITRIAFPQKVVLQYRSTAEINIITNTGTFNSENRERNNSVPTLDNQVILTGNSEICIEDLLKITII